MTALSRCHVVVIAAVAAVLAAMPVTAAAPTAARTEAPGGRAGATPSTECAGGAVDVGNYDQRLHALALPGTGG